VPRWDADSVWRRLDSLNIPLNQALCTAAKDCRWPAGGPTSLTGEPTPAPVPFLITVGI
jgi:hypothetical protein